MNKSNDPKQDPPIINVLKELFYTGSGQPTSEGLTPYEALPMINDRINQEVRKALDSIEVPKKYDETWYNKNLITHEQEVRETGIRRHNKAIDEYTANIKEVRKQYE